MTLIFFTDMDHVLCQLSEETEYTRDPKVQRDILSIVVGGSSESGPGFLFEVIVTNIFCISSRENSISIQVSV